MTVVSALVRVYHIVLCAGILYGVLLANSLAIQGFALLTLVVIVVLNHFYKGCELSKYERGDGLPSLTEGMKWLCLQDEAHVPLNVFERAVPLILVFLLLVRTAALHFLPTAWIL